MARLKTVAIRINDRHTGLHHKNGNGTFNDVPLAGIGYSACDHTASTKQRHAASVVAVRRVCWTSVSIVARSIFMPTARIITRNLSPRELTPFNEAVLC